MLHLVVFDPVSGRGGYSHGLRTVETIGNVCDEDFPGVRRMRHCRESARRVRIAMTGRSLRVRFKLRRSIKSQQKCGPGVRYKKSE
jgi:hypothetical protein